MEFIGKLLLLLFLISPTSEQFLMALVHIFTTRFARVRKHLGFYILGVITYYFIIWMMLDIYDYSNTNGLYVVHYFGGLVVLCAYHIWIVALSIRLRRLANAAKNISEVA